MNKLPFEPAVLKHPYKLLIKTKKDDGYFNKALQIIYKFSFYMLKNM